MRWGKVREECVEGAGGLESAGGKRACNSSGKVGGGASGVYGKVLEGFRKGRPGWKQLWVGEGIVGERSRMLLESGWRGIAVMKTGGKWMEGANLRG